MSLDSGHQEALEQDAAPTPPRPTGNPGTTTPWRQHELDTNSPHQHQHRQQHQHSSDHHRGFDVVEGAWSRRPEDHPVRGWGMPSRSPDGGRDSSNAASMGGGQRGFRVSDALPSPAAAFAPENSVVGGQARRWPQSPLPETGSAADVTTAIAPGRPHMGTGTNPSRPREKVSSAPAHVASLSHQHPNGHVKAPITKIAVLNALLLGGGPSEGPAARGSLSRTRATAGGTHPRRRRCSEGPKGGGGGGGGGGGEGEGQGGGQGGVWGRREDDICGPLPSIARLVEAGALLSRAGEGDWR